MFVYIEFNKRNVAAIVETDQRPGWTVRQLPGQSLECCHIMMMMLMQLTFYARPENAPS